MLGCLIDMDENMKYKVNGYPKREFSLIELIQEYQSKAGTIHTKDKAYAVAKVLYPLIRDYYPKDSTIPYTHWISVANSHHRIGEGRNELDYYCNKLINQLEES